MFGDQTTTLIACAIVRRNGEILLVRQRDKDGTTNWALPGGAAESAEGLFETLAREVREETGLNVLEAGPIAYAAQLLQPRAIAFVFEVLRWSGDLCRSQMLSSGYTHSHRISFGRLSCLIYAARSDQELSCRSGGTVRPIPESIMCGDLKAAMAVSPRRPLPIGSS